MFSPERRRREKQACIALNALKGEVYNMLSLMRRKRIGSSKARFHSEIPLTEESDIYRQFKMVQEMLQRVSSLDTLHSGAYIRPFLIAVRDGDYSIAGASLAAVNKFLLYGIINADSLGCAEAVNAIALSLSIDERTKELPPASTTAVETLKVLELMVHVVRNDCGRLLSNKSVWLLFETCFCIRHHWHSVELLRHAAENTVAHLVLTVFSRLPTTHQLNAIDKDDQLCLIESSVRRSIDEPSSNFAASASTAAKNDDVNETCMATKNECEAHRPHGSAVALKVLHHIVGLMQPIVHGIDTRALALSLINIVLETGGESMASVPEFVEVMRGDLCKWLLQNSQTEELLIMSLTLRVVYNLFNSIKQHMKVQLEVFFISVHLRIANSNSATPELKELALESLLDFCQEPSLMHDLFINYDCDIHCTNLFENLCKSLCRNIRPSSNGKLCTLQLLALEGLIAIVSTMSDRCRKSTMSAAKVSTSDDTSSSSDAPSPPHGADDEGIEVAANLTPREFQQRKKHKQRLATFVKQFNKKPKHLLKYASELGLLKPDSDAETVARFLFNPPHGMSKEALGDYLSLPPDKYPFNHEVLKSYTKLFNFDGCTFDGALRRFLTAFRLPGEAQKIERLMEAVAARIFEQCRGPLADVDAAFVLAFSIIMLHTDHHNPSVERKMTKNDFIVNLKDVNGGGNFPEQYLSDLYDSVTTSEFTVQPSNTDEESKAYQRMRPEQWDSIVLQRSKLYETRAFAHDNYVSVSRTAGVHEMEMFLTIADDVLTAFFDMFEVASTELVVRKALVGITDFGAIASYFSQREILNKVIARFSKLFVKYSKDLVRLVSTPSQSRSIAADMIDGSKSALRQRPAAVTGHRALLVLEHLFVALKEFDGSICEGWRNVLSCVTALLDTGALPEELLSSSAQRAIERAQKEATRQAYVASLGGKSVGSGNLLTDFLTSLLEETEDAPRTIRHVHQFANATELGALRAIICQIEIPQYFANLGAVRTKSLRALLEQLVIAGQFHSSDRLHLAENGHGGESADPRMAILCMELLRLVATGNARRMDIVWPYLRDAFDRLAASAQGLPRPTRERDATGTIVGGTSEEAAVSSACAPDGPMERSRTRATSDVSKDPHLEKDVRHYVEEVALLNAVSCVLRVCVDCIRLPRRSSHGLSQSDWIVEAFRSIGRLPARILRSCADRIADGLAEMFVRQAKLRGGDVVEEELQGSSSDVSVATKSQALRPVDIPTRVWYAEMAIVQRLASVAPSLRSRMWHLLDSLLLTKQLSKTNVRPILDAVTDMGCVQLDAQGLAIPAEEIAERNLKQIQFMQLMLQELSNMKTIDDDEDRDAVAKDNENVAKADTPSARIGIRDHVWLEVAQAYKKLLLNDHVAVRRRASSSLHTALLAPSWVVSGDAWKACFEHVLFPLVNEVHVDGSEDMRVRVAQLLARTCLHNISSIANLSDFHKLWFRIIAVLAKDMQGSDTLGKAVLESFKNVMVVMISTGTFDRVSATCNQDVLTMTWAFISTISPTLRSQIESMLGSRARREEGRALGSGVPAATTPSSVVTSVDGQSPAETREIGAGDSKGVSSSVVRDGLLSL